ncbi:MAG: hypothetical protein JSW58_06310 [Candidatus Latescibacterota bacterium]|nr:MAG: hypothetical protein JSW58_06310 [Candidatus Latescibacterota bacterium]
MIQLRERAGDSLQGAVDGINQVYVVSYDYDLDSVNIYVNGRLKMREWDDGFWVIGPRTVKLKEALLVGDSLEVEYKANVQTGGGADGGCPPAPVAEVIVPDTSAERNLPDVETNLLEPGMYIEDTPEPSIAAAGLRPTVIVPQEG